MSAALSLAGMFAGIILVGAASVYLHDLLERRWLDRKLRSPGGGRSGALVYRPAPSFGERRSAARGGQVVWVRAGGHRTEGSGADHQARLDQRSTAADAGRVTLR